MSLAPKAPTYSCARREAASRGTLIPIMSILLATSTTFVPESANSTGRGDRDERHQGVPVPRVHLWLLRVVSWQRPPALAGRTLVSGSSRDPPMRPQVPPHTRHFPRAHRGHTRPRSGPNRREALRVVPAAQDHSQRNRTGQTRRGGTPHKVPPLPRGPGPSPHRLRVGDTATDPGSLRAVVAARIPTGGRCPGPGRRRGPLRGGRPGCGRANRTRSRGPPRGRSAPTPGRRRARRRRRA